jgi:hypothetical protein
MKVKNCTQVFSHIVGTAMHVAARVSTELSAESAFEIHPKATETADLLLFFDKLFDSVNGSFKHLSPGKELRSVVTQKSKHVFFWKSCLPVISSTFFTLPNSRGPVKPPCLKNWIFSLRGLIYLTPQLLKKKNRYFAPRRFNQDPVENFFSCIRSHGVRNTNPKCFSFISSCKSLIVNNFVSPHSAGANCIPDTSTGALDNLRSFVEPRNTIHVQPDVPPLVIPIFIRTSCVTNYVSSYVAGFVAKKMLQKSLCDFCKQRISMAVPLEQNILISQRQFERCNLIHACSDFTLIFTQIRQFLLETIPKYILCYGIKQKLRSICAANCFQKISPLFCPQHQDSVTSFKELCVNVIFHSYLNNINKKLLGKDLRHVNQDLLIKLAYDKYLKRRKK